LLSSLLEFKSSSFQSIWPAIADNYSAIASSDLFECTIFANGLLLHSLLGEAWPRNFKADLCGIENKKEVIYLYKKLSFSLPSEFSSPIAVESSDNLKSSGLCSSIGSSSIYISFGD